MKRKKNQIATPRAREIASSFSSTMIVILVISLILGLGISFFISRELSNSAKSIQKGLSNFFSFLNKESKSSTLIELNSNDEFGLMAKTLNKNIQLIEKNIIEDDEFVKDVTRVINELSNGNMLARIEKTSNTPNLIELKKLISSLQEYLEHTIARDLNKLIFVLESFKSEDFTVRFPDPYAKVAIIINELGDVISNLLKQSLDVGKNA